MNKEHRKGRAEAAKGRAKGPAGRAAGHDRFEDDGGRRKPVGRSRADAVDGVDTWDRADDLFVRRR